MTRRGTLATRSSTVASNYSLLDALVITKISLDLRTSLTSPGPQPSTAGSHGLQPRGSLGAPMAGSYPLIPAAFSPRTPPRAQLSGTDGSYTSPGHRGSGGQGSAGHGSGSRGSGPRSSPCDDDPQDSPTVGRGRGRRRGDGAN